MLGDGLAAEEGQALARRIDLAGQEALEQRVADCPEALAVAALRHAPGVPLGGSWIDCFADVRPVEAGKTHLMLPPLRAGKAWQADQVLEFLLAAITGKAPLRRQQAKVVPQPSPPPGSGRARRPAAQPERKRFPWE